MIDREKVVNGIGICVALHSDCNKCPYNEGEGFECVNRLRADVLELMREPMREPVDINALVDRVVADKVEVQITIEPERTEVNIQPWKPYEMKCPYANGAKEGAE